MADDNVEYVKVKSPTGAVTIVPVELRDVLVASGYQAARRTGQHSDNQSNNN